MFKNVATSIAVFVFDTTTGLPKTGDAANLTAYVSKDYGTVTVLADTSATEMDSTNAKGWYLFAVAQAETNADALLFTGKSSTANMSLVGQLIFTTPANFTSDTPQTGDNYARLGAPAGASVSADIATVATYIDTEVAAIKAKTDNLPSSPAAVGSAMTLSAGAITAAVVATDAIDADALAADALTEIFNKVTQTALTEGYAADNVAPTLEQFMYQLWSALSQFAISGTALTCKKLDGSTQSMIFTLDDSTNPTSRTRTT